LRAAPPNSHEHPRPAPDRSRQHHPGGGFGWKALFAVVLVGMLMGLPALGSVSWALVLWTVRVSLLVWGALLVGIATANLFAFEGRPALRGAWVALAVGAYGALAVPGLLAGTNRLLEALWPVAALTLAAHLGRRDLQVALRDWGLVIALASYATFGMLAAGLLIGVFGPPAFLMVAFIPPLLLDGLALLLGRLALFRSRVRAARLVALVSATAVSVAGASLTLLNRDMPPIWRGFFALIMAALIGGALLLAMLTTPLMQAASGARTFSSRRWSGPGRALMELSHGPVLVSLILYIPMRLLQLGL
jgi:hypothetical protein